MKEKIDIISHFITKKIDKINTAYLGIKKTPHETGKNGTTYTIGDGFTDKLISEGRFNVCTYRMKVNELFDIFKEKANSYQHPKHLKYDNGKYWGLEAKVYLRDLTEKDKLEIKRFKPKIKDNELIALIITFDNQQKIIEEVRKKFDQFTKDRNFSKKKK